jgi:hypothetical protein
VSDTPRTDAVEAVCLFVGVGDIDGAVDELVEHARTLERENAQLLELVGDLAHRLDTHVNARSGTHYPGCETGHNDCALILKARAALAKGDA